MYKTLFKRSSSVHNAVSNYSVSTYLKPAYSMYAAALLYVVRLNK